MCPDTMPRSPLITTPRLVLVPATSAILAADSGDRRELGSLLGAVIPAGWPPPLLDDAARAEFIRIDREGLDQDFCVWYWVLSPDDEHGTGCRTLIGSGGIITHRELPCTVLIGYSVVDGYQGRGFASEALHHMIPAIFSQPRIQQIMATTCPDLKASVRVLEKAGFRPVPIPEGGSGMEEGTLAFILAREHVL